MKKINLLFSTMMVVLAFLVAGAAMVAPAMQTLSLHPASNSDGVLKGELLFDDYGRYQIDRPSLKVGKTYQFFSHDWRLVCLEGDTATFWMADPYTESVFDSISKSSTGIRNDGENIWTNGYTKTTWKTGVNGKEVPLTQSKIREFLSEEAGKMIDSEKYKDKVVGGYVENHNEINDNANSNVTKLAYGEQSPRQVQVVNTPTDQLMADWRLEDSDRLWIPSVGDLKVWGVVNVDADNHVQSIAKPNTLKWVDTSWNTTNRDAAIWLRTADMDDSYLSLIVYAESQDANDELSIFSSRPVAEKAGVRPAIHLDIKNITEEYKDHEKNPNNKRGWWDDDWLKALFMTVCILGVIGIAMVIIAVVVKVRRTKEVE